MKSADKKLRQTVAANLRTLMQEREWSQTDVAKKTGVSQRQISYMLSCTTSASFETLSAVAGAFGVPGWLLMIDGLSSELLASPRIPLLVASFRDAGPDGRELVERLAEREAVHNRDKLKIHPLRKTAVG
jgi:transcriptional regulator with XRE-family HTH domain